MNVKDQVLAMLDQDIKDAKFADLQMEEMADDLESLFDAARESGPAGEKVANLAEKLLRNMIDNVAEMLQSMREKVADMECDHAHQE